MEKNFIRKQSIIFALKNKDKNMKDFNKSFIEYYYSLPQKKKNEIDLSSTWGIFYRDWCKLN